MATEIAEAMAAQARPAFDNTSMWHNFTIWTAQHLGYAVNMSKLAPSLEDLVWAGPRMVMRLGRLGSFISFPDAVDGFGQRIIPESTDPGIIHATTTSLPDILMVDSTAATAVAAAASAFPPPGTDEDPNALVARVSMEGVRGLGNVFSYATSKWALGCLGMAVVLNRTMIFAATRRRLRLQWPVRFLLRILPIVLLAFQVRILLQSIQCQTSPEFAELRWKNASMSSELASAQANSFLHGMSSTLLFGATDKESCLAVRMIPAGTEEQNKDLRGSLSRLWPLFGTFCLSHFVETLSCAVQGRFVVAEMGMTLFEQSLAYAEADATIGSQLGWNRFTNASAATAKGNVGTSIALTRSLIMRRANTSPEVLLVSLISSMNHITSHVLGIFNLQSRFRLINTGFWSLCFMGSVIRSAMSFSLDDAAVQGLMRYPAVCMVGFIPAAIVLAGIAVCCIIYALALVLSALGTPETPGEARRLSFLERLAVAHENMQANVSLSNVRVRMDIDFYTGLLRAGFAAISMASEAVYLNEDSGVNVKQFTWLEDERFRELEQIGVEVLGRRNTDYATAIGLVPAKDGRVAAGSGYSRERVATQKALKSGVANGRFRDGVGAAERSGRWLLALQYIMRINKLLVAVWAIAISKFLTLIGVQSRPRWFRWLSQRTKTEVEANNRPAGAQHGASAEVMAGQGVSGTIPRNDRVDVEAEVRRWFGQRNAGPSGPPGRRAADEGEIDDTLYSWWLKGGWWGSADSSGDYQPPMHQDDEGADDPDFDTTSIISATDIEDDQSAWESEPEQSDDGQRTPTQQSPNPFAASGRTSGQKRHQFVDSPLAVSDLARLLHPTTTEERDEARTLAAHLGSDRIMTRSAYRRAQQHQRAQVLVPNRQGLNLRAAGRAAAEMTPEEEAAALEQILLARRAAAADGPGTERRPMADAGGPQCVVCQSAPRSVILWPCRCLSLCDDCRVSLAMNNFDKCVCCRREVGSFSRIYVP